ncbi:alpha/beta hydrolase [Duganella sp. LX20W]|uniref:Alpha/beta hydrolase n=1 Tax=Rugamonas brunnea TaxID=2758569 RepID=A0A7W2EWU7_9BURK|nr:alpha/beta hydrolase [Rugamonas brunnea]MBA5640056.1 alpha/beta hydrolase [Rugamonas brunnea]
MREQTIHDGKDDVRAKGPFAAAAGAPARRRAFVQGLAAVGALALAGCGGDGGIAGTVALGARDTPTRFAAVGGRKLAYRSVGEGKPIVLCHRFMGVLDWWDPDFIDSLAAQGFRVIYFDYSGMGQSTGPATYDAVSLAGDVQDLVTALGLKDFAVGGWSLGGMVAQIFMTGHGADISHLVLIGTTPPGPLVKTTDPLFFSLAQQATRDLDWFTHSFFEPADAGSRAAAQASFTRIAARKGDRSPEVPLEWALAQLATLPSNPVFPADAVGAALRNTGVPILHLGGDHDLAFPVENWYALNNQLPTLNLITYPSAGHGPHQQQPQAAAKQIGAFIRGTGKTSS